MPHALTLRLHIAEAAAELSSASVERYLSLLGNVEAIGAGNGRDTPWHLASYHGSHAENDAIERAITIVQRNNPLMGIH